MSRSWAGGSTRRWRKLRAFILQRDGHVCQVPVGSTICGAHATHADHIVPLAEGGDRWDPSNLRASCAPHNLSRTAQAARARSTTVPVHVVIGPPGAGKTTHVRAHAASADIVIDLDALAAALSPAGPSEHGYPQHVRHVAIGARAAAIRRAVALADGPFEVWIIHAVPTVEQVRQYVADGWHVEVVDPGRETVTARIRYSDRLTRHHDAADTWYTRREQLLAAIEPVKDWQW